MSVLREIPVAPSALRPSEYTAALIHALHLDMESIRNAHALEMGSGSGVVLAALAHLGAASLCGIDVEHDAVAAGTLLLQDLGHGPRSQIHRGDMWQPVAGRRFDLIAANLPHFAMEDHEIPGRHTTWSAGGPDGRRLLDPFLSGLRDHLAEGGRAVLTHNGFVGLDASRDVLVSHGLTLRVVKSVMVSIDQDKLALMTPSVLREEEGKSIHRYGPYAFAEMHVVEIAAEDRGSHAR
ncbi:methyltransferase domain-containing protein [Nisaea nitritireducens]|uniref:methyltransferase domain-containing protein n=1 Tax=Nisaea nitritireducens TaxID=568392 RepID=UPI0018669C1F|nr:methyltransferase domain-containing protein [Nisaea nitritireducens]